MFSRDIIHEPRFKEWQDLLCFGNLLNWTNSGWILPYSEPLLVCKLQDFLFNDDASGTGRRYHSKSAFSVCSEQRARIHYISLVPGPLDSPCVVARANCNVDVVLLNQFD